MASCVLLFFFSSRRRHTRYIGDWSSDVCSSDLEFLALDIEDLVAVDRVIPVNNDKILDVECKEFADAVDRVSTISTRSEERRVGKECRAQSAREHQNKEVNCATTSTAP